MQKKLGSQSLDQERHRFFIVPRSAEKQSPRDCLAPLAMTVFGRLHLKVTSGPLRKRDSALPKTCSSAVDGIENSFCGRNDIFRQAFLICSTQRQSGHTEPLMKRHLGFAFSVHPCCLEHLCHSIALRYPNRLGIDFRNVEENEAAFRHAGSE